MSQMTEVPEPLLVLNPRLDLGFHAFARKSQAVGDDSSTLQRLIRRRYPLATVLARAASLDNLPVWYVYRDGAWSTD